MDLTPFEGAERLADRTRQEIYSLTHGADADTAVDVLGLLTAAGGPLSEEDLAFLSNDLAPPSAVHSRRAHRLVTEQAARSLEPVGSTEQPRYQFAHFSPGVRPGDQGAVSPRVSKPDPSVGPVVAGPQLADLAGCHRGHAAVPAG